MWLGLDRSMKGRFVWDVVHGKRTLGAVIGGILTSSLTISFKVICGLYYSPYKGHSRQLFYGRNKMSSETSSVVLLGMCFPRRKINYFRSFCFTKMNVLMRRTWGVTNNAVERFNLLFKRFRPSRIEHLFCFSLIESWSICHAVQD